MNLNYASLGSGADFFLLITVMWGLFVTSIWIIIGWRAMKAHEKIAESFREYLRQR